MFGSRSFARSVVKAKAFTRKMSSVGTQQQDSWWAMYNESLRKNPLTTKAVTAGVIAAAADVTCQIGFKPKSQQHGIDYDHASKQAGDELAHVDWMRVAKFTILNALFVTPAIHYWYGFLNAKIAGAATGAVLKRVGLDQFAFNPILLPGIFSGSLLLDGTPEKIPEKIKADWASTLLTLNMVWVPVQLANFKFVPPPLQVLVVNVVGFFWNIYLSHSTFKEVALPTDTTEKKSDGTSQI